MQPLSAPELLDAWESGLGQGPFERGLALLASATPSQKAEDLANLSIGQRDARLLTLREWTFGAQMACELPCPACGERLELAIDTADIRAEAESAPGESLSLKLDDYEVRFRLPDSRDLASIAGLQDLAATRLKVLAACLLEANHQGQPCAAEALPGAVAHAMIEKMEQADPQADVQLALSCPACSHRWQATFDILTFFLSEIDAWARRVLREVHALASAYGWREQEILSLSPLRRRLYLDMVGG